MTMKKRISSKKGFMGFILILLMFPFSLYGEGLLGQDELPASLVGTPIRHGKNTQGEYMNNTTEAGQAAEEHVRITLTFAEGEALVKMSDNPTSRDFLLLLPLTLTFKDYARTEKISDLPRKLSVENAPAGSDPAVGDFTYYAPWGNLAVFYKDFGYSSGLILLGKIESGLEELASMSGDFTVTLEKVE
jgi:hypothetical protein